MSAQHKRALKLFRSHGAVRTGVLRRHGVHSRTIRELLNENVVERVERGLYVLTDSPPNQHQTLIEVCALAPQGAICLESALHFHELGVANPHSVWLAVPRGTAKPTLKFVSLELVYMGGTWPKADFVRVDTSSGLVRVTSRARTVVDCFKFRTRVGLETAIDALRAFLDEGGTPAELAPMAKSQRMTNVMRPYLLGLT